MSRAFAILRWLAAESAPRGVSEIARALGLSKATVHALVHTLAAEGALEPSGGKKFRLGPALADLAGCANGSDDLAHLCHPLMEEVSRTSGQTVVVGVPEGDRLRIVAVAEGGASLRIGAAPGFLVPLWAGAHGKVLLAWGKTPPPDPFPRFTVRTLWRPRELERERSAARDAGVAYDRGEYLEGVVAAAAPVLDHTGNVLAIVYAVGLQDLVSESDLLQLGTGVRSIAREVSRQLPSAGPRGPRQHGNPAAKTDASARLGEDTE